MHDTLRARNSFTTSALAAVLASLGLGLPALAAPQCTPHWIPGSGLPGANIYVSAAVGWDPDGAGPSPELLVISGAFTVAGDQHIEGLAAYDGTTWRALDPNAHGDIHSITAMTVYQGQLIAAGSFATLSGVPLNNIARFDGQAWHALGSGIESTLGYAWVNTLRVVGDRLLVGGFFDIAGGLVANNIAAWDGNTGTWEAFGEGLTVGQFYEGVFSITEHRGEIIAGGDFTQSGATPVSGVARFDGTSWHDFAPSTGFYPISVGTYGGELLAGGIYYDASNPDPFYWGDGAVYRWDELGGGWIPMGSGLGAPGYIGVAKLTEFNGELYATGDFGDAWDFNAHGMLIRRWDGVDWQPVGQDFGGYYWFQPGAAAEVIQGRLIAFGTFTHADNKGAFNLAAWDGAQWSSFGSGTCGRVSSMVEYRNGVVVSGDFRSIEGSDASVHAYWDGNSWSSLPQPDVDHWYPIGVFHGDLIGVFNDYLEFTTDHAQLYRLHGNSWQLFGEPLDAGYVTSMVVYRGELCVGGNFAFTGYYGEQIEGVARWDGHHWRALGAGVAGTSWGSPVRAMTVYRGKLIVAGGLDTAGGQPANRIASWNGNQWESLGGGLYEPAGNEVVWALAVYRDELVATGQFFKAGDVDARDIARWDGRQWRALGSDGANTLYNWGKALLVHDDDLYVGGDFYIAGGVEVRGVARWDGTEFHALDGGVDPNWYGGVDALAWCGEQLFVGGDFTETATTTQGFFARYGCD